MELVGPKERTEDPLRNATDLTINLEEVSAACIATNEVVFGGECHLLIITIEFLTYFFIGTKMKLWNLQACSQKTPMRLYATRPTKRRRSAAAFCLDL